MDPSHWSLSMRCWLFQPLHPQLPPSLFHQAMPGKLYVLLPGIDRAIKWQEKPVRKHSYCFAPVFPIRAGAGAAYKQCCRTGSHQTILSRWKIFNSTAATLKQFEQSCSNSGIIHLATHVGAATDLAMPGIEFYDSTLYINRIYSMPLKARLVVLSGCETGMGSVSKTEGLMSLARGFSYAGTKMWSAAYGQQTTVCRQRSLNILCRAQQQQLCHLPS